jgi:hypothetical protein
VFKIHIATYKITGDNIELLDEYILFSNNYNGYIEKPVDMFGFDKIE